MEEENVIFNLIIYLKKITPKHKAKGFEKLSRRH